MKIIMVDSLTGNDYSTCLCEKLYDLGLDVHLVVPENREFNGNERFTIIHLSPSKVKDKSKLKKSLELIKYFINLYRYIIENKPDAVHYQFFRRKSGIFLFKLLKLKEINLVHTAHNVLPHENSKVDYFLRSIIYKNSKSIIVHSNFIKNKLVNSFTIRSDKVNVVPHGDFDNYLPNKEFSINELRESFNLTKADNVILFFGYVREYKGLDTLIDAFELSALKDPKLKLLIAGLVQGKKLEEYYVNKITKSKNKDRVIFHPEYIPKEDVAKYFIVADLVALPYKQIDHSGIIHLAYSFGKPVIATNVGDFNEIIQNNISGIMLNGSDVEEFSKKITEAFKDKEKLIKMGKFARRLSETKYSWSDAAMKTINVYKGII